jgi:hypothetical protein
MAHPRVSDALKSQHPREARFDLCLLHVSETDAAFGCKCYIRLMWD